MSSLHASMGTLKNKIRGELVHSLKTTPPSYFQLQPYTLLAICAMDESSLQLPTTSFLTGSHSLTSHPSMPGSGQVSLPSPTSTSIPSFPNRLQMCSFSHIKIIASLLPIFSAASALVLCSHLQKSIQNDRLYPLSLISFFCNHFGNYSNQPFPPQSIRTLLSRSPITSMLLNPTFNFWCNVQFLVLDLSFSMDSRPFPGAFLYILHLPFGTLHFLGFPPTSLNSSFSVPSVHSSFPLR